jgi:UTP--glucose-1-phosphate uridylyltransferase
MQEVTRYGVISGTKEWDSVFRINSLVEKPDPMQAPSNMAIIGRYILTPDIFEILEKAKPGKGGEIQLTDAINILLQKRPVYGYLFSGVRYDAGDKLGYLKATVAFALKNPDLSKAFRKYLLDVTGKMRRT